MYTEKIDETTYQINEMSDWTKNFDEQFKPGSYVTVEIVDYFLCVLPPHEQSYGYLQVGEPHSHRPDDDGQYKPTWPTFSKDHTGLWKYCGNCFSGEIQDRP